MRPTRKPTARDKAHNTLLESKAFVSKTRKLIYKHDPIGLKPCPEDEYEPERASICRQLKKCGSITAVQALVHKEFVHWFGERIAGPPAHYQKLSKELFELYKAFPKK